MQFIQKQKDFVSCVSVGKWNGDRNVKKMC